MTDKAQKSKYRVIPDDPLVWGKLLPKIAAGIYERQGLRLSVNRLAALLLREAAEKAAPQTEGVK